MIVTARSTKNRGSQEKPLRGQTRSKRCTSLLPIYQKDSVFQMHTFIILFNDGAIGYCDLYWLLLVDLFGNYQCQ